MSLEELLETKLPTKLRGIVTSLESYYTVAGMKNTFHKTLPSKHRQFMALIIRTIGMKDSGERTTAMKIIRNVIMKKKAEGFKDSNYLRFLPGTNSWKYGADEIEAYNLLITTILHKNGDISPEPFRKYKVFTEEIIENILNFK
jgi:hypothetical protein